MSGRSPIALIVLALLVPATSTAAQASPADVLREASLKRYRDRVSKIMADEIADHLGLAREWLKAGLVDEGHVLLAKVLKADPENAPAREELAKDWPEVEDVPPPARKALQGKTSAAMKKLATKRWDLAKWCTSQELKPEARIESEAVIGLDSDHKDARQALGFVRYLNEWQRAEHVGFLKQGLVLHRDVLWMTPSERSAFLRGEFLHDGKTLSFEETNSIRGEWKNAWKLRSTHFKMRSNLPFESLVPILARLDLAWVALPDLFGLDTSAIPVLSVCWTRTGSEFLDAVPDRSIGLVNLYLDHTIYTTEERETAPSLMRAPMHAFEAWVQFGNDAGGISAVDQMPGYWLFASTGCMLLWLKKEGERVSIDDAALKAKLAKPCVAAVRKGGPDLLNQIVRGGRDQIVRLDNDPYWAMVLFCSYLYHAEGGRHRAALCRCLREVVHARGSDTLFASVFGCQPESFHAAFLQYLEK